MRQMGLRAIYPRVKTGKKHPEHKIYPHLLGSMKISSPDQVWSTDITYIRLRQGFVYLVAMIEWFSRYVLSWRLSNCFLFYNNHRYHQSLGYKTPFEVHFGEGGYKGKQCQKELLLDK